MLSSGYHIIVKHLYRVRKEIIVDGAVYTAQLLRYLYRIGSLII